MLRDVLGDSLRFTESLWTEPVGITSDNFLNCLGTVETTLSQDELTAMLKQTERSCGDTPELRRRNMIGMDIDLLLYGGVKLHPSDWQRGYVRTLAADLHTAAGTEKQ